MAHQSRLLPFLALSLGLFLVAVLWLMFSTPDAPQQAVTHDIPLPAAKPVQPLLPVVTDAPPAVTPAPAAPSGSAPSE